MSVPWRSKGSRTQQMVINAFTSVCRDGRPNRGTALVRPRPTTCTWRAVGRAASPAAGPAPFEQRALAPPPREEIVLLLGGQGGREAARLFGVWLHKLRQYVHVGLWALHAATRTALDRGYAPVATGDDERSGER